ncbi:MAG: DUF928 domain-containing protein [Symploca sp. SIO2E9]|nr:DUF928 domain-containing protein [Symploca sp. SIO2E9]
MSIKRWKSQQITLFLTLIGLLFGGLGILKPLVTPGVASAIPLSSSRFLLAKFTLPSKGAPGDRRDAGTRNPFCSSEEVIALVPATNLGLTVAERPKFWFYVPYSENRELEAEFSLTDKNNNEVYKQTFSLTDIPGIVSISLPETVSPLEVEQLYSWRFSVICNPNHEKNVLVSGGVERVPMNFTLKSQLEGKNSRESIAVYAENGLWFDALTTLAELRRADFQDKALNDDWVELLQQVNLTEINDKPLVECCTAGF